MDRRDDDSLVPLGVGLAGLAFDVVMNALFGCGPLLTDSSRPRATDGWAALRKRRGPSAGGGGEAANSEPMGQEPVAENTQATSSLGEPGVPGSASVLRGVNAQESTAAAETPPEPIDSPPPSRPAPSASAKEAFRAPRAKTASAARAFPPGTHFRVLGSLGFRRQSYWIVGLYESERCLARFVVALLDLKVVEERFELWIDAVNGPTAIRVSEQREGDDMAVTLRGDGGGARLVRFSTLAEALLLGPRVVPVAPPGDRWHRAGAIDSHRIWLPRAKDGSRPILLVAGVETRRATEPTLNVDMVFDPPGGSFVPGLGPTVRVRASVAGAGTLARHGLIAARVGSPTRVWDIVWLSPAARRRANGTEERTLCARLKKDGPPVLLTDLPLLDRAPR